MNIRRVFVLFFSNLKQSYTSFFFIFALAIPIILSVTISALFGSLFTDKPKIAILDEGHSELVGKFNGLDSVLLREYTVRSEIMEAVEAGVVDLGLVLPGNFDTFIDDGSEIKMDIFVYGGSLLKDRAILATTLVELLREMAGQEIPVEIETALVGDAVNIPWEDRLLPMIVLISIVIGGFLLPATSIVEEKQKRTLTAITVAPASLTDVFVSKGMVGVLVSLISGILTLVINQAWGAQPALLIFVLILGAIFASSIGVLLGAVIKDINTLFATVKSMGIFLYAPGILFIFPNIPDWIAKVFPTYYMMAPVLEISQTGAGWGDIATNVYILIALILVMFAIIGWAGNRLKRKEL